LHLASVSTMFMVNKASCVLTAVFSAPRKILTRYFTHLLPVHGCVCKPSGI